MVVLHSDGVVFVDGKKVGTCKKLVIERNLNEPTRTFVTTWSETFELVGYEAERAVSALRSLTNWYRDNRRRQRRQAQAMRRWTRR